MRPDGRSLWFRGLFPLYFLDHGRVSTLDKSAQLCQFLASPTTRRANYGIYLLRWRHPVCGRIPICFHFSSTPCSRTLSLDAIDLLHSVAQDTQEMRDNLTSLPYILL